MNPELEKKLIEDLEKSGFSSELRAIRTFLSCEWGCTGFANYFDLDEEKIRGVDLLAIQASEEVLSNGVFVRAEFLIVGEVKKSQKPWILFKENRHYIIDDYVNNLVYLCDPRPPYSFKDAMAQDSLYKKFGWTAYGIHESFKDPDAQARSYSALITVSKAAESILETYSAAYKEQEQHAKDSGEKLTERILQFVKPIIILDGLLVAASLKENGEIALEEVKYAPIEFHFKSKGCRKGTYLVDIVTLDNLKEYIEISEKRRQTMLDRIKSLADKSAT
jgi:hypothetical protein